MAKRARPKEGVVELPYGEGERGGEFEIEEVSKFEGERLKEEVATGETVGGLTCKEETITSEHVVAADVAVEDELEDGSFWSLLIWDGYTIW